MLKRSASFVTAEHRHRSSRIISVVNSVGNRSEREILRTAPVSGRKGSALGCEEAHRSGALKVARRIVALNFFLGGVVGVEYHVGFASDLKRK
ncbi:MAG: hypothetical protein N3G20_05685 [Verrucomicrobiae bacterium]|nr:hypothetical protein [Verrucomicrobiae bacterium]